MNGADVQDKVDQLARSFLARLPARLVKIDEAFALGRAADLSADALNPDHDADAKARASAAWQELYRLLHSLGGAAGTFGVAPLGEAARRIELLVQEGVDGGGPDAARIDAIDRALQALHAMAGPAPQGAAGAMAEKN